MQQIKQFAKNINVIIDYITIISGDILKNSLLIATLALITILALCESTFGAEMENAMASSSQNCITKSQEDLKLNMRALWEEHILWTHLLVMAMADNTSDKDVVTARLLRNPEDMANAIRPYYGNENADKFSNLIKEHLLIAAGLVEAAKAGNNSAAAEAEKNWYDNADEIAAFQSSINPYWKNSNLTAMWHEHLSVTKDDAVARLTGNYSADVENFDKIANIANDMADYWADGIINQFPDKFKA